MNKSNNIQTPKLGEELINVYALILEEVQQVSFFIEDIFIHIYPNNKGWRVETWREGTYSNDKGSRERLMVLLTDDVCIGDEYDAIKFVLNME
ncbi:MAG: hypothetical protein NZ824_12195 [Candidatus Thioglobus sp.]|nr:hypothetical protein [Candidatus Thioglobus sp.]